MYALCDGVVAGVCALCDSMVTGVYALCDSVVTGVYALCDSVTRSDYLNTFEFMDKLAANLQAKLSM